MIFLIKKCVASALMPHHKYPIVRWVILGKIGQTWVRLSKLEFDTNRISIVLQVC